MTAKLTAKRPFLIYVLIILFLLGGASSLTGTIGVFQAWNWWLVYSSLMPVFYHIFVGVLLTLVWFSMAVILWQRLSWAIPYCSVMVILTTIWFWVDRLFLTKNPLPFSRHALLLSITCVFLIFVFCCFYLVAPFMNPLQPSPKDDGNISIHSTGEKNDKSTTRN